MGRSDYRLTCKSCRYLRPWPEKTAWEKEAQGAGHPSFAARICVHPERTHPVRVGPYDCPYNCCSSQGAQSCPIKIREMVV